MEEKTVIDELEAQLCGPVPSVLVTGGYFLHNSKFNISLTDNSSNVLDAIPNHQSNISSLGEDEKVCAVSSSAHGVVVNFKVAFGPGSDNSINFDEFIAPRPPIVHSTRGRKRKNISEVSKAHIASYLYRANKKAKLSKEEQEEQELSARYLELCSEYTENKEKLKVLYQKLNSLNS